MAFVEPAQLVEEMGISTGAHVVDIGAGSGHYAIAAAKKVGGDGKVFAIDVQKELLERLNTEAQQQGVHNIQQVWGNGEKQYGTRLRDESVAAVIIANVLFQLDDKPGMMAEIYRIIKTGGKLLVVDWEESFGGIGPQSDQVVPQATAQQIAEQAGFTLDETLDGGEHHYALILHK